MYVCIARVVCVCGAATYNRVHACHEQYRLFCIIIFSHPYLPLFHDAVPYTNLSMFFRQWCCQALFHLFLEVEHLWMV